VTIPQLVAFEFLATTEPRKPASFIGEGVGNLPNGCPDSSILTE
jgi:hypothetical protein